MYAFLAVAVLMVLDMVARHAGYDTVSEVLRYAMWPGFAVFMTSVLFSIGSIAIVVVKFASKGLRSG